MTTRIRLVLSLTAVLIVAGVFAPERSCAQNPEIPPNGYVPPIYGEKLEHYCSHPNERLVVVTKQGTMKIQLFDKIAPNHVAQILRLAKGGWYDSTTFQRIIPWFMIQNGDPKTKHGSYQKGFSADVPRLKAEFNEVHHVRGIRSMARVPQDSNSASAAFFIVHSNSLFLDRNYTVWGQVTEGIETVDKVVNLKDAVGHTPEQIKSWGADPGRESEIYRAYVEGK